MQVLLQRSLNLVRVTPDLVGLLAPLLTFQKRIQGAKPADTKYVQTSLFQLDGNGALIAPGGLYYRIINAITAAGYSTKVDDMRVNPLPPPDFTKLPPLRPGQDEMLLPVLASDGYGVIESPTGSGKSFLMRALALVYPNSKFVITTPRAALVQEHYATMADVFPLDEVGMVGDGKNQNDRRITITTTASLSKVDLERADILLFDEVHSAAAPCTARELARTQRARMFGFSATPYGRGDNADLETEALFGPRIVEKTYQEVLDESTSLAEMECVIFDAGGCPEMVNLSGVPLSRHAVWRNSNRNKLIAHAVRWVFNTLGEDAQVLIGVDKVEHAVYLGHLLPDFKLVYSGADAERWAQYKRQGLLPKDAKPISSNEREQARLDFAAGKLRRAISTGVWSTGVNFPNLNAIVRADASGNDKDATQWAGRASRRTDTKTTAYIIDFNDKFNRLLGDRAARRLTLYRKKGWKITSMPGLLMAPAQFPSA